MQGQIPHEIEVWYILPAIRRELTKSMINDLHLTQKEIAKIMGLTEAAVSQYIHSKREKEIVFSNAVLKEIKQSAKRITENELMLIPEMVKLCRFTDVMRIMCDLHKKQDVKLPEDCDICFEENLIKIPMGGII